MKWMVAPSYANAEIRTVDETTHKAYIVQKCDRCGGTGWWGNTQFGGICFKCNGARVVGQWVKAYTETEYDKYVAAQQRAKERKAEQEAARKQALIDNSESNKLSVMTELGYNIKNPQVFVVFGDNTYSIKDELKTAGARYNASLGWFFTHEVEVPEGFQLVGIPFDDVFDWQPMSKRLVVKENAKEVVDAVLAKYLPESLSEYIGEIKERVRDIEVTLTAARQIDGYYGVSTIFTFKNNENVLTWITTSCPDIEIGDQILLTGTVKDHKEYKGVKQTVLSRCIVKKGSVA